MSQPELIFLNLSMNAWSRIIWQKQPLNSTAKASHILLHKQIFSGQGVGNGIYIGFQRSDII